MKMKSASRLVFLSSVAPITSISSTHVLPAAETARTPMCPVMAHFGEKDHWISMESVQAFAKAQPGTDVHVYAADHGFNCDQRGSWDAPAAKLALERTLAFFAKHVG